MSSIRVSALPAADLDRVRSRGVDDFGNALTVRVVDEQPGTPVRCCLREAGVGERVALLAWRPSSLPGPYAEVGPVFVHAEDCGGPDGTGYPDAFRHRSLLFRAYGPDGWVVDNVLADADEAEGALETLMARGDVDHVHARNPLAGCYMFRAERAGH